MLFSPIGSPGESDIEEVDQVYSDDIELQFGTDGDVQIQWDTGQTNDALLFGLSGSNNIIFCEVADMGTDFTHANSTNPTVIIQSADATTVTDFISFSHNQTDAVINVGGGSLQFAFAGTSLVSLVSDGTKTTLLPATGDYLRLGDAGTTSQTLNTNDDVLVAGKLEVDGIFYADSTSTFANTISVLDAIAIVFGTGSDSSIRHSTAQTPDAMVIGVGAESNGIVIVEQSDVAGDYAHAQQTNPTLFIHSATAAASATTQWISLAHNQTNAIYNVGIGGHSFTQTIMTSGSPVAFTVTGAAHTSLTASTESSSVLYDLSATVQFATGALATQRAFRISAPTYGFVGASTLTDAATFYVSGAPIAGTNATITNSRAIWVEGGMSEFTRNALGAAATDATTSLLLANTTDAAAGAQQWSPMVVLEGQGWKTDATAATQEVQMGVQVRPVQGAANPTGALHFLQNINDGGFSSIANITSAGALTTSSTIYGSALGITSLLDITSDGTVVTILPATGDYLRLGDAGTTSQTLNTNDDVLVTGKLEVDGIFYADSTSTFANTISVLDAIAIVFGTGSDSSIRHSTAQTPDAMVIGVGAESNGIVIVEQADVAGDYAHAQQTNPTLFIHSATAAASATNQWISLAHNQTNAIYNVGTGGHSFTQTVMTSGSPVAFTVTGAAHTSLTASTESSSVLYDLSAVVQFATGALATQRAFQISAPTYGFVGASTLTDAATFYVSGAPIAGTNATITNSRAIWVASGLNEFHRNALGAAATDATVSLLLANTTDAAAGAQQWSPLLVLEGQGWKTDATAATRECQWALQVRPVQGAANPTGVLHFLSNTNDGGFTSRMNLEDGGTLNVQSLVCTTSVNCFTDVVFSMDSGGTAGFRFSSAQTPDSLQLLVGSASNGVIICEFGDTGYDFAHAQQTNPTVWIQSANQSATEWLSLAHNQTNAIITSGAGDIVLSPAADVAILSGKHLQLGNNYAAGVTAATGSVQMKDLAGVIYNFLCVAA